MSWIVAAILTGIIISGFGWLMTARTITGARTFTKVLGFENFLGRVEADQIEGCRRSHASPCSHRSGTRDLTAAALPPRQ
jgi:hypothetical protein